jgi:NAD(P)-dependent dehydrogenase (short-subunit alcohol dehydrogenase family)
MRLDADTVALVTGGANGIGNEVVRALLQQGCKCAVADLDEAALLAFSTELSPVFGSRLTTHRCDVSLLAECEQLVREVLAAHGGRLTLLVNNAGIVAANSLGAIRMEDFRAVIDVNLWAPIVLTKLCLPALAAEPPSRWRRSAYVVNVSSLEGVVAIPGNLPYCVSKFAVRGFSEALACDAQFLYPHVGVLCVMPGFVQTDMIERNQARIDTTTLIANKDWKEVARSIQPTTISIWFKRMGSTTPASAAAQILRAVRKDQSAVSVGTDSWILSLLARLFGSYFYAPLIYWPAMAGTLVGVRIIGKRAVGLAVLAPLLVVGLRHFSLLRSSLSQLLCHGMLRVNHSRN